MKKIIIILIFCAFQYGYSQELYPIGIGGGILGSVNANANQPPKGRQTGISLNYIPSIMFSGYLPYSKNENIGMYLDFGLTNLSYSDKSVDYGTLFQTDLSYLSGAIYLHLNGFLLGVNIGYPISVSHQAEDTGLPFNDDPLNTISTMAELRIGYQVPLYTDDTGRLLLNIMAAYQFNGVYTDFTKFDPNQELIPFPNVYPPEENQNPRIASIYIGVSYLINIIY